MNIHVAQVGFDFSPIEKVEGFQPCLLDAQRQKKLQREKSYKRWGGFACVVGLIAAAWSGLAVWKT